MKEIYSKPIAEIEKFSTVEVLTESFSNTDEIQPPNQEGGLI